MGIEAAALGAAQETEKVAAGTLKEVWSALDAAAEKPAPSEYLKPSGVSAMQAGLDDRPSA